VFRRRSNSRAALPIFTQTSRPSKQEIPNRELRESSCALQELNSLHQSKAFHESFVLYEHWILFVAPPRLLSQPWRVAVPEASNGDSMMKLSNDCRAAHRPDGTVILDPSRGKMFGLNPVGSQILEFIRAGLTETQIAKQISETFAVDLTIVQTDVQSFLRQLATHHIIANENGLAHK
jgi:Coenzyme PQQ synthesis protein D (PqqD)